MPLSSRELAAMYGAVDDKKFPIPAVDVSKIYQMVQWRPQLDFVQALKQTVEWNRDHGQEFWKDELDDLLQRRGKG